MNNQTPVGENRPPCSPAPQNAAQQNAAAPNMDGHSTPAAVSQPTAVPPVPASAGPVPPNGASRNTHLFSSIPLSGGFNDPKAPSPPPNVLNPNAPFFTNLSMQGRAPAPQGAAVLAAAGVAASGGMHHPGGAYVPPVAPAAPAIKPKRPFATSRADGWFFLACVALGFLLVRWGLWAGLVGWGVAAFTGAFAVVVLLYARAKNIKPSLESWYWLGVMLLCGLAFAFWPGGLLTVWRVLLLFGAGGYWCACLFGTLMREKTSNLLPLDAANLLFAVPLHNLDAPRQSMLPAMKTDKEKRKHLAKRAAFVAMGLLFCIPVLGVVLPMLQRADTGNFSNLLGNISRFFQNWRIDREVALALVQLALGIPVAWYFASLAMGAAHRRYHKNFSLTEVEKNVQGIRIVPVSTVAVVLYVTAAVYVVFIACQVPYFFSAFGGVKPEAFDAYSTYAREGFFELCRIAAINLGVLVLVGCCARTRARESRILRMGNYLILALTLLILVTAFSKMGLYIAAHGFTPKRICTCVFMIFLAGVCVAAMVFQRKSFSLVRFAALFGAGLLCVLCLCNLDGMVVGHNTARYQSGTLGELDALIVLRSGPAGVPAALEVYNALGEEADYAQRLRLAYAIDAAAAPARYARGTSRDSIVNAQVRALQLPELTRQQREEAYDLICEYYFAGQEADLHGENG